MNGFFNRLENSQVLINPFWEALPAAGEESLVICIYVRNSHVRSMHL